MSGILEQKAMKIFILDKFGYVVNVAKLKRLNYNKIFVENLLILYRCPLNLKTIYKFSITYLIYF